MDTVRVGAAPNGAHPLQIRATQALNGRPGQRVRERVGDILLVSGGSRAHRVRGHQRSTVTSATSTSRACYVHAK